MIGSPYLTIEESAQYLRVDEKTLRRHVMRLIEPLTVGRRKFYTREMLDEWHDRKRGGSSARRDDQASRSWSASRTRRAKVVSSPRVRETLSKLQSKPSESTSPSAQQDPRPSVAPSTPPSDSTST